MSNLSTNHPDSLENHLDDDEHLREELQRLAAAQAELLETTPELQVPDTGELTLLRNENTELRSKLEEFDLAWGERQREYENLLEEKSEVIRGLHLEIQRLKESAGPRPEAPVTTTTASTDQGDVCDLKRQLEEERLRLQEDEEALMVQMRQMEMAMSKERAELARQRTEIQRMQVDLNNEIEKAARNGHVLDRLQSLRKPYEQATEGKTPVTAPTPTPQKKSGLFRRLFG
jgi:hypothetical protein